MNNNIIGQKLNVLGSAGGNAAPAFPPGLLGTLEQTLVNLTEALDRVGSIQNLLGVVSGDGIGGPIQSGAQITTAVSRTLDILRLTERINTALAQIQSAF